VSNSMVGPYRRRTKRRRGQALVEFCLVIPIFLLVLCGIMDFGFLFFDRMTVINASREGARAAAMVSDASTATLVAQQAAVSAAAQGGLSIGMSNVVVTCIAKTGGSIDCATAETGDSIRVSVTYSYHPFFPLLAGSSISLGSSVQMVFDSA
jgi:Flp pilus assembly protein TadG